MSKGRRITELELQVAALGRSVARHRDEQATTNATIVDGLGRLERRVSKKGRQADPVPPYVECSECAAKTGAYLLCESCLKSRTRADRAGCTCHVITSRVCPVHPDTRPKASWSRLGTIEWAAEEADEDQLVRRRAWPTGRVWDGEDATLNAEDVLAEDWELA